MIELYKILLSGSFPLKFMRTGLNVIIKMKIYRYRWVYEVCCKSWTGTFMTSFLLIGFFQNNSHYICFERYYVLYFLSLSPSVFLSKRNQDKKSRSPSQKARVFLSLCMYLKGTDNVSYLAGAKVKWTKERKFRWILAKDFD